MANQASGPGTFVTHEQRVRYQPCFNQSDYDAPPFAAMRRHASNDTAGEIVDGVFRHWVFRPDAECEARQDPADIVFNGPEVLPSKKPGRCTEDVPCRALHLASDVIYDPRPLPGSAYVGPKADSWLLWDSGDAFRWLGTDGTMDQANFAGFEVGLVVPVPRRPWVGSQYQIQAASNTSTTNGPNEVLGGNPGVWVEYQAGTAFGQDLVAVQSPKHGIKILVPGIYHWTFSCTLTGAAAPQGSALTLRAYLDDSALQYATRLHQLEIDNYGVTVLTSAENVAMSGHFVATRNQVLNFRNLSAASVICSAMFCELHKIGR